MTGKAWIVQSGSFEVSRYKAEFTYNLVDPGKDVGIVPPPPPPPPPPDPDEEPRFQAFQWNEPSYISTLSSSPPAVNSAFEDDELGGYGASWYPESDVYWIGPPDGTVHPLPADPRDTIGVSRMYYLPPKPEAATMKVYVRLRPYINWNPHSNTFTPKVNNLLYNGNVVPPPAPYAYPVSAPAAFSFEWRIPDGSLLFDANNQIQAEHAITGTAPDEDPPANSTVHATLNSRVQCSYPFSKMSEIIMSALGDNVLGNTVTRVTMLDSVGANETGVFSSGGWTSTEEGWYGIIGDIAYATPDDGDYHNTNFFAILRINTTEQENTGQPGFAMYTLARVCRIAYLRVGDYVTLYTLHRIKYTTADEYRAMRLGNPTRLAIYKLIMS